MEDKRLDEGDEVSGDNYEMIDNGSLDSNRPVRSPFAAPGGLVRIDESSAVHGLIERKFISGLESLAAHAAVVAIHWKPCSDHASRARLDSFKIFTRALEKKCGGDANVKRAWFATSRDEMDSLLSHGFGDSQRSRNSGLYGSGIYLSPVDSSLHSVKFASMDGDGLRHVLLCRVLLGKTELVPFGSKQCHPSSENFDSGVVGSLAHPDKYIIWSTHMNTHILPECVVSFRAPVSLEGFIRRRPSSPWIPIPALLSQLSLHLSPVCYRSVAKFHDYFMEKKISRQELVQRVRRIAGDELLVSIIKSFQFKNQGET